MYCIRLCDIPGTDLEQYLPKNFGLPENSPFLEKSPPNTAKPTPKPKPQSVRSTIKKVLICYMIEWNSHTQMHGISLLTNVNLSP